MIESYNSTKVTMKTQNDHPGLLVTADINYPGWKAYVDGRRADILEVNYTFRGIALSEGEHTIEFKFIPTTYIIGIILLGIAMVAIIIAIVYLVKISNNHSDSL